MKKILLFSLFLIFSGQLLGQNVSCLEFDSDDSYYVNDASDKLDVTGSNWTIEVWVYPTTTTVPASGDYPVIISRKYSFELYFRNNGGSGSQLGVGFIAFDGGGQGFDIEATLTSGDTELTIDYWHHIAVSYDGTTTRMFFDGSEVGSSTDVNFDLDASISAINFGARYDGGYSRYVTSCAFDEIRYSDVARYTADFSVGTSSHPHTTDANTILLYHLNENTGTSITNDNDADFNTSLRSSPNDATWRAYDYYSDNLPLQFVIDGDLSDDLYKIAGSKLNSNSGFGTSIDVSQIKYYADNTNSTLYIGIQGKLNTGSSDAIGLWFDISGGSSWTGAGSGTNLGISGGGSYIGAADGNYTADFEVDFMFALNPGGGATDVYFDAGKHTTGDAHFQGTCDQVGTSSTNTDEDGTVFTQNSLTFAFNNGGASNQGFEIALPYAQIGASSSTDFTAFAFVTSANAYFSDVSVPGDISGNPEYNPDFANNLRADGSTSIGTAPYNTAPSAVPVQLTTFTATDTENGVVLNWETATEVNNYGFEIERKMLSQVNSAWETIGFVDGHGNSNAPNTYLFVDNSAIGNALYRLKQLDFSGSFEYSNTVEVSGVKLDKVVFAQNYPNPFNPSTTFSFSIPSKEIVTLAIYNTLGEKVAELINQKMNSGTYNATWNAQEMTSGVYFARLSVGTKSQIQKIMLLK